MAARKDAFRADSYLSAITIAAQQRQRQNRLTRVLMATALLEERYLSSGLAMSIVDRPAQSALARGVTIEGDEGGRILQELERLCVNHQLALALKMALLHGAAALLLLADDQPSLAMPLSKDTLKQVRGFRAIPGTRISATTQLVADELSPQYGLPEVYTVTVPNTGRQLQVHWTRLIPVSGESSGMSSALERLHWQGRSALASCWDELQAYEDALQWSIKITERKQSPVYKMKGMADLFMTQSILSEDGTEQTAEDIVQRRITAVDAARSVLRTTVVDADDEFSVHDLSLSGVSDVVRDARIALAAAARMPVSILFGDAPKGLGNQGESDMSVYQSRVSEIQSNCVAPAYERVVELIVAQAAFQEPPTWSVRFNPLWEPSEKEKAETGKLKADSCKAEVEAATAAQSNSWITPEEGREWLRRVRPDLELEEAMPADLLEGDEEPTDPVVPPLPQEDPEGDA